MKAIAVLLLITGFCLRVTIVAVSLAIAVQGGWFNIVAGAVLLSTVMVRGR